MISSPKAPRPRVESFSQAQHARQKMSRDRRLKIDGLINGPNGQERPDPAAAPNGPPFPLYRFIENEREYYAFRNAIVYPFPIDEPENNRVDILHCLIHEHGLSKKLHNADLGRRDHRLQILDVGCGTGIWPLEMAKESPDADVVGIDLITNQATREGLRNVRFQTPIDFTSPDWGLTERAFDFVRMSQLCGSVPSWSQLYYTVSKYLRPGDGYVEHIELDWRPRCLDPNGYPPQAKPLFDWYDSLHYASGLAERSIAYREDTEALLTGAGFTDINHKIIRIPLHNLSTDAREHDLAQYYLTAMCIPDDNGNPNQSFEGLTMSLSTRQLRWAPHQVKSLCDAVRDVCKSNYQNLYHNVHVWTARKPAPQRSSTNSRARVG